MKDAQKPDHVSLNTIISRLKDGRYVIPDFQRDFEWKPWDVRELMRSIFLDYYIGSLLLWKGSSENFDAMACEPIYGYSKADGLPSSQPEHIVLDGQQRLTAMFYCFLAPDIQLPTRANRFLYFIHVDRFMNEIYEEAFSYDWTRRGINILGDREAQFKTHNFPLAVMGQGGWELGNWVQDYERYWRDKETQAKDEDDSEAAKVAARHAENARAFGEHLKGITEQYQIAYIELDKDLAVDKVCDIFTQINSKGIQLDVFDLINALLKPKGLQLKHLWRESKPRLEFVETHRMNVYVLQVMSILRQAYCSPKYLYYLLPGQAKQIRQEDGSLVKEVLVPTVDDFESRWRSAVDHLEYAIKLLRDPREFGAVASKYLPYVSILPVFAALQSQIKTMPANRRLSAKRKLGHWYWAAVFTSRYSGSVESTSARDFLDVAEWFEDDDSEPPLILEFENRFRNLELRKETKPGGSIYNGIFNLLVLNGARDWMTGDAPQHDDLDDHHIVPESWGKENLPAGTVHTILNRTPLTADTNRHVIGKSLPNEYLPALIEQNGEAEVRSILESHFISPVAQKILMRDPFGPEDFEEFVTERQRTIKIAIEDLLIKERLDLSPQLRELDERVEKIELSLRAQVTEILDNDIAKMPPHLIQKVDERIQKALKKNAALDSDVFESLGGKLEYFDLRDLEEATCSKMLWPLFEEKYQNKVSLKKKFDQLAELRNGIRHSRDIDAITRKEGEAAILWFEKLLD